MAKVSLQQLNTATYLFFFALAFPLSTSLFWIFDRNGRKLPKHISFSKLKYTLLGTCTLSIGVLMISFAFTTGKASLVSTISSSYVALTAILAYIILKEKLSLRQIVAILMVSLGVLFIGS